MLTNNTHPAAAIHTPVGETLWSDTIRMKGERSKQFPDERELFARQAGEDAWQPKGQTTKFGNAPPNLLPTHVTDT